MLTKNLLMDGVEDIHYEDFSKIQYIISNIKDMFKSFGYRQTLTPTFEYYDLYDIDGALSRDNMYKLIDDKGKVIVLRPDATIPITRMAAMNFKDKKKHLKFSYVSNIFRRTGIQDNSQKEFMQAGIEYLGSALPDCDAEVISIAIKTLIETGVDNINIDIGQSAFLGSLIDEIHLDDQDKASIYKLIEAKNIGDLESFLTHLKVDKSIQKYFKLITHLYGEPKEVLNKAKELVLNNKMNNALNYLSQVYQIIKDYGYEKYISFDLGFTNQMNYYTGLIFKGYISNFGEPILSGGRYDSLSNKFGINRPACGFGININKLIDVLKLNSIDFPKTEITNYMILYSTSDRKNALKYACKLRKNKLIVETLVCENVDTYIQNNNFSDIKNTLVFKNNNIYKLSNNKLTQINNL